ncbi:hypothetical protein [Streptomyces sp. NPDC002845]
MPIHTPAAGPVGIVTEQTDPTADRIIIELDKRDIPVVRFDLADFPTGLGLDAVVKAGTVTGSLTAPGGRRLRLDTIRSILWWHPGRPEIRACLPEPEHGWAQKEATAGLVGVLAALDCLHINAPDRGQPAQNKVMALRAAADCGLSERCAS